MYITVYVYSKGEDGAAFSRQAEWTEDQLPGWIRPMLEEYPYLDNIRWETPLRPNHSTNHCITWKYVWVDDKDTDDGEFNAKD